MEAGDAAAGAGGQQRFVHVWLDVAEGGAKAVRPSVHTGLSDIGLVQRLGPYRLRVLSYRVVPAGSDGGDGGLQQTESLEVSVSVDKLHPEAAAVPLQLEDQLTRAANEEQTFWLSTQGAGHVSLSDGTDCAAAPAADGSTAAVGVVDERFQCSLPPLTPLGAALPPLAPSGGGAAGSGSTVEFRLHARLRATSSTSSSESSGSAMELAESILSGGGGGLGGIGLDAGFGCAASTWDVSLDAMSLGAEEGHVTLPLSLVAAGAPAEPVRLGGHELRVLQAIGHYTRPGAEGAGTLVSDYPLLLLHVRVGLRRLPPEEPAADASSVRAQQLEAAKRLGAELERLLDL